MKHDEDWAMSSPIESRHTHIPNSALDAAREGGAARGWSLGTELLGSFGGLIAVIVSGFAISLYCLMWRATYRQVEADLLGASQMLVQDLADGGDLRQLAISETYLDRFGRAKRDRPYFAVWDAAGRQIAGTQPLPPHVTLSEVMPETAGPHPFLSRSHGHHLEVVVATPSQGQLLIGRPLAKEYDALRSLMVQLTTIGMICLSVGLAGAWWLARRIARPIAEMATAAEQITSRNLAVQLNPGQTSQEMMRLAGAFNRMLAGLRAAFERQTRFTADAAHELRTPVTVVLAQTEHTLSRDRSLEDYQVALQTCLRSAQHMKKLIEALLVLARADAGQLITQAEAVDFMSLVQKVIESLRPYAIQKRVRLECKTQPASIFGDRTRLEQVVTNLVMNGIQYNDPGGDVVVRVFTEKGMAVLAVQDHGRGIPLSDQPHLFDRFYRVDRVRTHEDDVGTGPGLSIVAEIVSAHQGTIQVESEPDQGTTMTVRLPLPRMTQVQEPFTFS